MGCCASVDQVNGRPFALQKQTLPQQLNSPDNDENENIESIASLFQSELITPLQEMLPRQVQQPTILFKQKKYSQAVQLYKKYIYDHIDQKVQIDGLGQVQQSNCYYQWFLYEWYRDGIKKGVYKGTVYDALALCYLAVKDDYQQMEKGLKWYRSMIDSYPQRCQLIFGYACMLNNKGFYDEALDYYKQAIQLRNNWTSPYQCIAYIYEYKRVEKTKAVEYANKLLTLEVNNRPALFVLARNQSSPQLKIEKLKQLFKLYPEYVRAANEIGIVYGGTIKDYDEAINWYKKCLQVRPMFNNCYNNIGINYKIKKEYELAIQWLIKAIQNDKEYLPPHKNLTDIFDALKYTDIQVQDLIKKYNILEDYFYFQLAYAYRQKKMYDQSLKYYKKAESCAKQLKKVSGNFYNSIGALYDDRGDLQMAINYYTKSIEHDSRNHMTHFNLGITYKKQGKVQKAIQAYKKAIQINPNFSQPCNNLGNIYKDKRNFQEAIKYYKRAVQHNSTYTLAWANMGVCYLELENYRDAFQALYRANDILPYDNNNLSQGNKSFLKEALQKFNKQGDSWRLSGGITKEQRQKLKNLIKSFESNFKQLYTSEQKTPVNLQKVMKKQILQIVQLVHQAEFQLSNIDKIFKLVKQIFEDNEQYFHIIPQLFMQYFYKQAFIKKKPILEIQATLFETIKRFSTQSSSSSKKQESEQLQKYKNYSFKLKNFSPPTQCKVNLFKNTAYFKDYSEIFSEIMSVNNLAKSCYKQFKDLVDYVRKQSYGIPYGVGMKIPSIEKDQFKVVLRIFEKMFKHELNAERVKLIISKIDESLQAKQKNAGSISLLDVVHEIMQIWTGEITQILKTRKEQKIETKCQISDMLRGKVMFESVDHIKKALYAADEMCHKNGYNIIQMENRLSKQQTRDVVLKIQIREIVCEFQLALKQQESKYHFVHCIYEIERSPLGCIFGSYIFMSKGFSYTFLENCKDIVEQMEKGVQRDPKILEAAKYIVATLNQSQSG